MKRHIIYLFGAVLLLLPACTTHVDSLEWALRQAGKNRAELEKVLQHYESDSLKLAAATFLIRNMPYHIGFCDTLFTPNGISYMPDIIYSGHDEAQIKHVFDSLFHCGYYIRRIKVRDVEVMTSDFLIDNIECAFEVWNTPWAEKLDFDAFCRYILPYRASNEPLCPWRRKMLRKYLPMVRSSQVATPVDACMLLNDSLKGRFDFVGMLPVYSSVEMVDRYKQSNCEGLALYFIFLLRSVGIPVAIDCTTWAKSEDGHSWCSVMDNEGEWHGFAASEMSCEEHRKKFSEKRKLIPPKVYRRLFAPEPVSMDMQDDGYRTYVKNPLFKDVTDSYYVLPVNIMLDLQRKLYSSDEGLVYLCASSINQHRVLGVGTRRGDRCFIKNVVGDNTFVLAESPDGKTLHFLTDTFYVDKSGVMKGPDIKGCANGTVGKKNG